MNRIDFKARQAFTLLEIGIIVAIIGVLAALAVPSVVRYRKLSQGRRIVNDARVSDGAINAWAMEFNKADGDSVDLAGAAKYSKAGAIPTTDVLGNPYGIGPVGSNQVRISTATKTALSGVGVDWGGY